MLRPRVIPVLLLKGRGLYKSLRFKSPQYVGDPINTLRIFCEKEVDEVIVLDIEATRERREPRIETIRDLASECFMPLGYGGGVRTVDQARAILKLGVEKIVLNSIMVEDPTVVSRIADLTGSSSVVVSIDAKRSLFGNYEVLVRGGTKRTGLDPVRLAEAAAQRGAGEIMINAIDRDGTMQGYDLALTERVAKAVDVPVIACGGAGNLNDLKSAIQTSAAAAAAGAMFVFQGRHRAVLISYPSPDEMDRLSAETSGHR